MQRKRILTEAELTSNKIIFLLGFNYILGLISLIPLLVIDLIDVFKIIVIIVIEFTCLFLAYLTPKYLAVEKAFTKKEIVDFNITGYIFGHITLLSFYYLVSSDDIPIKQFCLWMLSNVLYHMAEFSFVCLCHPQTLTWDSFLINHSREYGIMVCVQLIEHAILSNFTNLKENLFSVVYLGVVLSCIGHLFRIGAFYTAKSNFHHQIQTYKVQNHKLVTNGIYSITRHPGYFGWYCFSVGCQLLLVNPISLILVIIISTKFFYERIEYEEQTLINFFGKDYIDYRKQTPIRIPLLDYFLNKKLRPNL